VTRFISHCDQVDEGLGASRGGHPMKYMAILDTEPLGQDQDVGGPQQTLAGKVGPPCAVSGQAAAVRVGSRAGEGGGQWAMGAMGGRKMTRCLIA
jgi:hypothetical protein